MDIFKEILIQDYILYVKWCIICLHVNQPISPVEMLYNDLYIMTQRDNIFAINNK